MVQVEGQEIMHAILRGLYTVQAGMACTPSIAYRGGGMACMLMEIEGWDGMHAIERVGTVLEGRLSCMSYRQDGMLCMVHVEGQRE